MSANPSVLIVEDDRKMARVFATSLEAEGYQVFEASTGQRAIEEVRTRNPDIIVLDLGLPDIGGEDVASELRRRSDVPILMLTARSTDRHHIRGLEAGADDYVTKPFSLRELVLRCQAILRRGRGPAS